MHARRRVLRGKWVSGFAMRCWVGFALVAILVACTREVIAQPTSGPATVPTSRPVDSLSEGRAYPISRFELIYLVHPADHGDPRPTERALANDVVIKLGVIDGNFVVPESMEKDWIASHTEKKPAARTVTPRTVYVLLSKLPDQPRYYYNSALWAISEQLKRYLGDESHLLGVFVIPSPAQIDPRDLADLRQSGDTSLQIEIYTGVAQQVHTIASGTRINIDKQPRVDNPLHKWIREHSPVKPAASQPATSQPSFLRRDLLDAYVSWLNRQPGRHVDVAVSKINSENKVGVSLDYLITEARPWSAYFQVSNTGTRETNEWRERFGYVNNQFTNHDDILTLDYTTAGFTESQDVAASYELPISPNRRLRARFYGDYDEFTASDVGFGKQNFNGEQYSAGGELVWNVAQFGDAFLDVVAGARYEHVAVLNNTAGTQTSGSAVFAVPYGGLRFERITDIASTTADATLQGRLTDATKAQLNKLGRLDTDPTTILLQADVTESFFLEPLLFRDKFIAAQSTLANEVVLSLRGQYSFGGRLIPQAEEVAGGLYSVRGYPESVSSGDSVILASAEYRYHVPRGKVFIPQKETGGGNDNYSSRPFHWKPQAAYARPDWDLILRGFVDVGQTYNTNKQSFERNDTLIGTGLGVEVDVKQNFTVRVDWGIPLNAFPGGPSVGESRVHVSATLLY